MPIGPGKYDGPCTDLREATSADVAMVIVLGGKLGSGFSVQAINPFHVEALVDVLKQVTKEIEASI